MEAEKIISDYYNAGNENERFSTKHGMVEYIITRKYIEQYLHKGCRILEVGAGTGRYALHYAHLGYEVDAVELVQANLDILSRQILPTDNIRAVRGNALDLSVYKDDIFDRTFVLGPMYHLFTSEDKMKCLKEALRVTKKGGILFIAYCQFDASMMQAGFIRNMYGFLIENELLDEERFLPISKPKGIFELYRKEQIDALNAGLNVKRLNYVGTDMFSHYYKLEIDSMDDRLYEKYLAYTMSICENQNLVGLSNHTLDILEKL